MQPQIARKSDGYWVKSGSWAKGPFLTVEAAEKVAEANHKGAMVALFLDHNEAGKLAVPGGEPPEDMHITLLYLAEDASSVPVERWEVAQQAVAEVASQFRPLQGRTAGMQFFPTNAEGETPYYMAVNMPEVVRLREALKQRFILSGWPIEEKFPKFVPHITLQYVTNGQAPDAPGDISLGFDVVQVVKGNERMTPAVFGQPAMQMASSWHRSSMAQRSGDPKLDALIDQFIDENPIINDDDPDYATPLQHMDEPSLSQGECGRVAEMFLAFIDQQPGIKAQITETNGQDQFGRIYGDEPLDNWYPERPIDTGHEGHAATKVTTDAGTYLVDFTASQFGITDEWPVVQKLDDGRGDWQRHF